MHMRAEPRRQPVGDHLDDPAERVAIAVRGGDLLLHRGGRLGVEAADRVRIDACTVTAQRDHPLGGDRADADDVTDHLDAADLIEERPGHGSERDSGCGLAGTGPLEDGPHVVEGVLLHADEVRVAGTGSGEHLGPGLRGENLGGDGVGRHDGLPLGPLGVGHLDGHRPAHGGPMPNPAGDAHSVLLELHPGAATGPQPAAGEVDADLVGRDGHAGRDALDHRGQRGAVRLTSGQPTKHGDSLPLGQVEPSRRQTATPPRRYGPNAMAVLRPVRRMAATVSATIAARTNAAHTPMRTAGQPSQPR